MGSKKKSHDPGIENEPHLRGEPPRPDPSEWKADRTLAEEWPKMLDEDERAQNSVWDEPGVLPGLTGDTPIGEITYARWLHKRSAETTFLDSWIAALAVAMIAGPLAVLESLWAGGQSLVAVLSVILFAPIIEETTKIATVLYVAEKKPFLFKSSLQIGVCSLAAGLAFATIENVMYLHVYIAQPSAELVLWRWTVCVALHTTCTFIAGLGVIRVWRDTWQRMARPRLSLSFPYMVAAVLLHGAYNGFALLMPLLGYDF